MRFLRSWGIVNECDRSRLDSVGGIWVFWDDEEVKLKLLKVRRSYIHMEIGTGAGRSWMLAEVYANPNPSVRRFLWKRLEDLIPNCPWALVGDFNCVLKDEERCSKKGDSPFFKNWVCRCSLIDVGYIGSPFTWRHGVSVESRRAVRLDRPLCYDEWRRMFPSASIRHLAHGHSDHCPILLELQGVKEARLGERPFKFQAVWLLHTEFYKLLEKEWVSRENIMRLLKCFAEKLSAWNRDTFGNNFWRKKRQKLHLVGPSKVLELDERVTLGLLKLKFKLKREWAELLLQEESFWMQKSRIDRLRLGDKNTKFFHTSTLIRRRRN